MERRLFSAIKAAIAVFFISTCALVVGVSGALAFSMGATWLIFVGFFFLAFGGVGVVLHIRDVWGNAGRDSPAPMPAPARAPEPPVALPVFAETSNEGRYSPPPRSPDAPPRAPEQKAPLWW